MTPPSAASSPAASAVPPGAAPPLQPFSFAPVPFYSGKQSGHMGREKWTGSGREVCGGQMDEDMGPTSGENHQGSRHDIIANA